MSGSGGGSVYGGGGFGGGGSAFNCDLVNIATVLNSPDPNVLSKLSQGEVLLVVQQGSSLVAIDVAGQVAGSLTPPATADLINCLEQGYSYEAVVTEVDGSRCRVKIRVGQSS